MTDASGRFRLTGLPVGSNAVGFIHPYADSLALRGDMLDVEVGQAPVTVALGIPAEAFCSEESLTFLEDDGVTFEVPSGGLVGFAEDAETGRPVAGARIEADWEVRGRWRLQDAQRGIGPEKPRGDEIVADASGRFLVCPVPLGNTVRIRGAGGRRLTIEMERRLMHANVVVR